MFCMKTNTNAPCSSAFDAFILGGQRKATLALSIAPAPLADASKLLSWPLATLSSSQHVCGSCARCHRKLIERKLVGNAEPEKLYYFIYLIRIQMPTTVGSIISWSNKGNQCLKRILNGGVLKGYIWRGIFTGSAVRRLGRWAEWRLAESRWKECTCRIVRHAELVIWQTIIMLLIIMLFDKLIPENVWQKLVRQKGPLVDNR